MATAKHWITLSAISALGIGMVASGAIGIANAMALVDVETTAEVPPISSNPGEGDGVIGESDVTFPVPSSAPAPSSAAVTQTPVPAPQPVAPRPATTHDNFVVSPASVASPADVDD